MELIDSVLIVGGGGREHALLKALLRSDRPLSTFAYPGNPGMERDGCMIVDQEISDWDDLAGWALMNEIGLTVVGPEVPLTQGIVDIFKKQGLVIFGPSKAAAQIEGSKAFAKKLMRKYGIPTAEFEIFKSKEKDKALAYVEEKGAPIVVKASGLAAGKGAIVCGSLDEAKQALGDIFAKKIFGAAGETVVIEEMMSGPEASVFVLTDGKGYKLLPVAQDHKRIGDGDTGPNTGGMGAYAPAGAVDAATMSRVEKEIIVPTLAAMEKERARYRGLLYIGLMITADGPKVVEYNCRFGDPEAQAVLPLVHCDWYDAFLQCANPKGNVSGIKWKVDPGYCVSVVMASTGYPGKIVKGKAITGIDAAEEKAADVCFAGVAEDKNTETYMTAGGRVLAVSAKGETLGAAIAKTYEAVAEIAFEGAVYRTDIGAKGLEFCG